MDPHLRQYLIVIVVLLSLIVGFLVTGIWILAESPSPLILVVPPAAGGFVAAGLAWTIARNIDREDRRAP